MCDFEQGCVIHVEPFPLGLLKFWACPGISCSRKFIFVRSKVLGSFFGWFLPSLVLAFFPSSAFVCVQSYTFHWWWLGLYLPCFCFHMSRPGLIYVVIILWGILAPRTLQPLPCTRQLWELRSGIWTYCWRHLPFAPGGGNQEAAGNPATCGYGGCSFMCCIWGSFGGSKLAWHFVGSVLSREVAGTLGEAFDIRSSVQKCTFTLSNFEDVGR